VAFVLQAKDAVVNGRYRLERELGRGGMGSVWVAHDLSLDTPCAVKFIDQGAAGSPELRARFEREAKAAARLRSPNVVQILDHGVCDDTPFIAMELLEGESLGSRIARLGRLPREDTIRFVSDVARALTKAHAAGIVHRDLKPENIFLARDDDHETAKVLDFGIAKTRLPGDSLTKTRTGMLLGTPCYMSPEQANGTLPVDAKTDLWSLGVIAFQCVTGRLPFESEALGDLLDRIMNKPIPVPSRVADGVPPAFDVWFRSACARSPEVRFSGARELAEALREALTGTTAMTGTFAEASAVDVQAATLPSDPPPRNSDEPLGDAPPQIAKATSAPRLSPMDRPGVTFGGHAGPMQPPPRSRWRMYGIISAAVGLGVIAIGIARSRTAAPAPGAPLADPEAHIAPPAASTLEVAISASADATRVEQAVPTTSAAASSTAPSSRPRAQRPRPLASAGDPGSNATPASGAPAQRPDPGY
jgi:serine/threonine-protein kinase